MPKHFEPLHRGLHTARDPATLAEGELTRAKNARLSARASGVFHAEGRQVVGGGGHGAGEPLRGLVGLTWDPGQELATGAHPYQLLYVTDPRFLYVIPATSDPDDPAMAPAASPAGFGGGRGPYTAVNMRNQWFVFGGGNLWIRRDGGQQLYGEVGMPEQPTSLTITTTVTPHGNPAITGKWVYYWFTYYDATGDVEGTAQVVASTPFQLDTNRPRLLITVAEAALIPDNATHLRVYRSRVQDAELPQAWPTGYRIAEVPLPLTPLLGFPDQLVLLEDPFNDTTSHESLTHTRPLFEAAVISIDGERTAGVGRRSPPPEASTADVFEGSLVLNDIRDPRKVRFSWPEDPHAFPATFYINFEGQERDRVVALKTLGKRLGVFLENEVHRINWLPREADPDFGRGRVTDLVVEGQGVASSACVTRFSLPGAGPMLAFANSNGLFATDLTNTLELSSNVDWKALVGTPIALIDNPAEFRLEVYYREPTATRAERVLFFHYHDSQLVDGRPAVMGPVERPGGIDFAVRIQVSPTRYQVVTSAPEGSILYEHLGYTDEAASASLALDVETRELYLAGLGEEFETRRFFEHTRPSGLGAGPYTVIMYTGPRETARIDSVLLSGRALRSTAAVSVGEFVRMRIVALAGAASMSTQFVGVDWESLEDLSRG